MALAAIEAIVREKKFAVEGGNLTIETAPWHLIIHLLLTPAQYEVRRGRLDQPYVAGDNEPSVPLFETGAFSLMVYLVSMEEVSGIPPENSFPNGVVLLRLITKEPSDPDSAALMLLGIRSVLGVGDLVMEAPWKKKGAVSPSEYDGPLLRLRLPEFQRLLIEAGLNTNVYALVRQLEKKNAAGSEP